MDDVIFSRIFLLGNFDNFMNLKRTCKRAHKVSKLVWKQWIKEDTKIYTKTLYYFNTKPHYESYEYYNGRNGKHMFHGVYIYSHSCDKKMYQHGKLHGERLVYKGEYLYRRMNYERGSLHGPMIIYSPTGERVHVRSVRFYNKGKKCCSISNNYDHFCPSHYKHGMKLINWTHQKFLSKPSEPVFF